MAYTGKCMLTGDKLHVFYKYVEEIMGRPVYTHEMGIKAVDDEIREKSKADFVALCKEPELKTYKEFKIGEKIPPEEWQKGMSVTEIIDEVRERMCNKYCKYPYEWDEETQGELSESEICASCPLNRL
jgi:hypothetical protein